MKTEYFINLTNGLEFLLRIHEYLLPLVQFLRIQSTHLEQNKLEELLQNLDSNFLMKLAIGRKCVVIDFGSRGHKRSGGNVSRACWMGIPWILYCLNKVWFNRNIKCEFGMHHHFEEQYKTLTKPTKRKLKYFRKFLLTDEIHLEYICEKTTNDGDIEYYREIVEKYL